MSKKEGHLCPNWEQLLPEHAIVFKGKTWRIRRIFRETRRDGMGRGIVIDLYDPSTPEVFTTLDEAHLNAFWQQDKLYVCLFPFQQ